jgi:hypothetical protein
VSVSYTIWIYDALGRGLAPVDNFVDANGASFVYQRAVNNIGVLTLNLPRQYEKLFDNPARWVDYRLGVWRRIDNGLEYLDTDTIYFVRKVKKRIIGGVRTFVVTAYSAIELLKRRHVAANAETAAAKKTDNIDDMMKAIVREQLGASAAGIRNISTYLSVEPDASAGTSITKAFSRDMVLNVLQDLAQHSGTTATPIFFDIVAPTPSTLEFRTRANQWGEDRSTSSTINKAVILSPDDDTLTDIEIEYDYSNEANYIYVGGSGQESNRVVEPVFDSTRYSLTPLNLRELFVSYTNSNVAAVLQSVGYAALRDARPKKTFTASVQDAPSARYGKHWFFGDTLTTVVDADYTDVRVDAIQVSMQAGKETIQAKLRAES